jgi:hypothetical protein
MAETALKPMTPEEFFRWQLEQEERYELVDGFPVRMETGASERHDRIVVNISPACTLSFAAPVADPSPPTSLFERGSRVCAGRTSPSLVASRGTTLTKRRSRR